MVECMYGLKLVHPSSGDGDITLTLDCKKRLQGELVSLKCGSCIVICSQGTSSSVQTLNNLDLVVLI